MQAIEIIEQLGGTSVVADLPNINPHSICKWKANNRISDDKLIRLAPVVEAREIFSRKTFLPNDWHRAPSDAHLKK